MADFGKVDTEGICLIFRRKKGFMSYWMIENVGRGYIWCIREFVDNMGDKGWVTGITECVAESTPGLSLCLMNLFPELISKELMLLPTFW
jgi:hypothetical protein